MKPGLYVTLPFTYAYPFEASGTGSYVQGHTIVLVVTEVELGGMYVKALVGDRVLFVSKETLRKV